MPFMRISLSHLAVASVPIAMATLALGAAAQTVQSEARVGVQLQACQGGCAPPAFAFNEQLWRSRGDGDAPASYAFFSPDASDFAQYASVEADLTASRLRLVSTGLAGGGYSRMSSFLTGSIGDTFSVSQAGLSRLSLDITGALATQGDPTDYYTSVALRLLKVGSLDAYARGDYANYISLASVQAGWGGPDWGSPDSLQVPSVLELVFEAPTTDFEWAVEIFSTYTLTDGQGVNVGLGNTIVVHFDAPVGAAVSSASGYLPTATGWAPTPAVPEPGSYLMFGAGLALLCVRRRLWASGRHVVAGTHARQCVIGAA